MALVSQGAQMLVHRSGGLPLPEARGSPLHKTRRQSCVQPACLLGCVVGSSPASGAPKRAHRSAGARQFRYKHRGLSSHFLLSTEFSSAASFCPVTLLRCLRENLAEAAAPDPISPNCRLTTLLLFSLTPPATFPQSQRAFPSFSFQTFTK